MRASVWRLSTVLLGFVFLSACGGGGGGGSDYQATPHSYPSLEVKATTPVDLATQVPVASSITVQFSEAIDPATVNTETCIIKGADGSPVMGALTVDGDTATFTPAADLALDTVYTVTLTTGIFDVNGNPMLEEYYWSFTTTPPNTLHLRPGMGETNVYTNSIVSVTFSIPIDAATVSDAALTVRDADDVQVQGTQFVGDSSIVFVLPPESDFAPYATYTANLAAGITDLAGNPIPEQSWSFTTGAARDQEPPTASPVYPADGSSNVWAGESISATFSEPVNPYSVNSGTFLVTDDQGAQIQGTVAVDDTGKVVTFTPTSELGFKQVYHVTLTAGIQDMAGNCMEQYSWTFTTGMGVVSVTPGPNKRNVFLDLAVSITFSEAVNPATINDQTFSLVNAKGEPVAGTLAIDGANITFTPAANFAIRESYTATLTTGVQDLEGNPLPKEFIWTFTTGKRLQKN